MDLEAINKIRVESGQLELLQSAERKQVFRWATSYTDATSSQSDRYSEEEARMLLTADLMKTMPMRDAFEEFGVPSSVHYRNLKKLSESLGFPNVRELRSSLKSGATSFHDVKVAKSAFELSRKGRPTKLMPDEEALVVATAEMRA